MLQDGEEKSRIISLKTRAMNVTQH